MTTSRSSAARHRHLTLHLSSHSYVAPSVAAWCRRFHPDAACAEAGCTKRMAADNDFNVPARFASCSHWIGHLRGTREGRQDETSPNNRLQWTTLRVATKNDALGREPGARDKMRYSYGAR